MPHISSFLSILLLVGSTCTPMSSAYAIDKSKVEDLLKTFQSDPKSVMDRKSETVTRGDGATSAKQFLLSKQANTQEGRDAVTKAKNQQRDKMCMIVDGEKICLGEATTGQGKAAILYNDRTEKLVQTTKILKNLSDIEAKGLMKANLPESPWSDDYWAIAQGVLGFRYADDSFQALTSQVTLETGWKTLFDYSVKNPATKLVSENNLDGLSPSEKYDLLVGDTGYSLTKSNWKEGKPYWDDKGSVEGWMGICHGWAPAAVAELRPSNAVTALAADGKTKIKFYPSDIKALASLLWAKVDSESRFIGGRCDITDADLEKSKDPVTGRVNLQECFDTNPGTWHTAIVNKIGVQKKSFVMDATFDYQVWNQPVYGYQYYYINEQTGKIAKNLEEAMVPVESFTQDKFKKVRSPKAKYIVGVSMDVQYVVETSPSTAETDSAQNDNITTDNYLYDLELDENQNIIGGEWYSNTHPDFLWTPVLAKMSDGTIGFKKATTYADMTVNQKIGYMTTAQDQWTDLENRTVPDAWKKMASYASKQQGAPIRRVVESLINAAQVKIEE